MVEIVQALLPEDALTAAKAAAGDGRMDMVDALVHALPPIDCPLEHRFTPGLYSRQMFVPHGTILTSKIHKTTHQFIVSTGELSVWTENEGVVRMKAPYHGVTVPGTRRVMFAHADSVWTTFHPIEETDLDVIEDKLIYPHVHFNPELISQVIESLELEAKQCLS
jgi:hypothetical protein